MTNSTTNKKIERAPVVVVMGHIDHGKSTLLDQIKKTNLVSREAGGITQHMGAYEAECEIEKGQKKKIVFIDTPGHEAFVCVRESGARAADLAILIVSAEDGVKPQTKEAFECITQNKIPFVLAINKIDSEKANVEKTKNSLLENGIYFENYGGEAPCLLISAKTGEGIQDLLLMLILLAEMNEISGDSNGKPDGFIIETGKDKNRGYYATIILKEGKLNSGDNLVSGSAFVSTRIMEDINCKPIKSTFLSEPIRIYGWSDMPTAGEKLYFAKSKQEAEELSKIISEGNSRNKNRDLGENVVEVPLILKADSFGSLKAIEYELEKISVENVFPRIISKGIGEITESDAKLASSKKETVILGFGTRMDSKAKSISERDSIKVANFKIIYELIEYLEKLMLERKPKIKTEKIIGRAKILKVFSTEKNKQIIGGRVSEGFISLSNKLKILRREELIGIATIKELQKSKMKTSQVEEGDEFGMAVETKIEIVSGDVVESFEIVEE